MNKTRYKIRKEQLERVVESFVMESAEGTMIDKNAAKKHKMSMGAEQSDDMGEGMEKAKEVKHSKMKQAPEAKKHMKGSVSESKLQKFQQVMEALDMTEEELLNEIALLKEYDEAAFMKKFKTTVDVSYPRLSGEKVSDEKRQELLNQAKDDNFNGDVKINKSGGKYEIVYIPSGEVSGKVKKMGLLQRLGMGTTRNTRGM